MTNRDLQENLISWFNKNGFPLEIETARAFFGQRFGVEHSAVYPDPETQKSREIDVLAYRRDETGVFGALFPVECKAADKPWVVLTNPEQYFQYGGLWIAAMSPKAREAMAYHVTEYLNFYEQAFGPTTGGFSLKQAFCGEADHAYTACMSALKAAYALVADDDTNITLAFPTLVVNTPIYEYSEDADGQQIFKEVTSSSFSFSAHMNGYSRAIIRIVSNRALPDHTEKCRVLSDHLKHLFVAKTKAIFRSGT